MGILNRLAEGLLHKHAASDLTVKSMTVRKPMAVLCFMVILFARLPLPKRDRTDTNGF